MPTPGNNPPQRKGWREASQPSRAWPAARRSCYATGRRLDQETVGRPLRIGRAAAPPAGRFLVAVVPGAGRGFLYYVFRPWCERRWWPSRPRITPRRSPPTPGRARISPACGRWARRAACWKRSGSSTSTTCPPWESKDQWLREFRRQIDTAVPGGPARNTIIIYLSLHGVVDDKGEPCLIPPGASPWQSSQWVRVRDLLTELFLFQDEKGHYATKIKGWDKLLVLDCNRIDANWSLGQFYNGFRRAAAATSCGRSTCRSSMS